jgi:hypothetical protein
MKGFTRCLDCGSSTVLIGVLVVMVVLLGASESPAQAHKCTGGATPVATRLVLKWVDPHRLFPAGSHAVMEEVEAIFEQIAVQTVWKQGKTFSSCPGDVEVQVLLRPSEPRDLGLPKNAMGLILSNKSPQSSVWIFFPNVARNLGHKPQQLIEVGCLMGFQERLRMAKALGRIIAHEVVHAVAPELPHTSEGVMRPRLYGGYILKHYVGIDDQSAAVFRAELAELGAKALRQASARAVGVASGSSR